MNKYLVTYEVEGKLCEPVIETATQIFNKMDMDDCYDIKIIDLKWLKKYDNINDFRFFGYPQCHFSGTWCCKNPSTGRIDPLRMEINVITGHCETLDVGYGTDH